MDEGGSPALERWSEAGETRNDEQFVELLQIELPRVQRIAALLAPDRAAAEDLVAEAVAKVLPAWRAGRVDDCGSYLRRVLSNLARQRWRRLSLSRSRDHAARTWVLERSSTTNEFDERDRTLSALRRLPPRRRAVVVLRFYDDLAEAAIADVLGISVGTVKSQLARALEQLRRDMEDLN
jgi:RNA polymerase sigma-70 factor (sigma-E family)